ncbi:MAG: M1 family metallopeptidase [Microscillaceae bacterium]|nr:M1 family metallopeptidase [Microscillaceae bacterium]MDW8461411.1 M1 family metallopeptidase [Cytophagales bacterium]
MNKKRTSWIILIFWIGTPQLWGQEIKNLPSAYKNLSATALRGALRFERTCYDVKYYELSLKIDVKNKYISGSNIIFFQATDTTSLIQIDLDKRYTIDSICFAKKQIPYFRRHNAIFTKFPSQLQRDSLYSVQVFYRGKGINDFDRIYGSKGMMFKKDAQGRDWIGVSCEQAGASLWFPNKDHLSDEPDSVRLHWIYPNHLKCISNGRLEATKKDVIPNYDQSTWFVRNPINNYNITFYLGNYLKIVIPYTSVNQQNYEIHCYFLDYDIDKAYNYYKHIPQFLRFFEEKFGEYPYWSDKFAVVQSPYLGMEHQGCLAIGEALSGPKLFNHYYTLNAPYHSTLIHEIAHEWWGNSVSASDMAHVWLHEGFATYCEMLYIEKMFGRNKYLENINFLRTYGNNNLPVLGRENINENMFENGNVYFKGACVIHDLREEINDDKIFFDILKTFQQRYKNKTVTTQHFVRLVNEKTNRNFTRFFEEKLK